MKNSLSLFIISVVACLFLFNTVIFSQDNLGNRLVGPQSDGSILVPTNQLLRPAGFQIQMPGRPVDLALSPNGEWLVVKNRKSVDLIRISDRTIMQTLPYGRSGASFTGIVFSQDGRTIYVTEAKNRIHIAEMNLQNILSWREPIILSDAPVGGNPVPGGFVLVDSLKKILVTLSRSNSLAIVNLEDNSINEIPTGIAPYDVALFSSAKAYVSNWGGRLPKEGESTYNSSGSQVLVDPKTGIGNNGSVSVIDLVSGTAIKNMDVGLHPNEMVFSPDKKQLFVACSNSDKIFVIDTKADKVVNEISVHLDKNVPFGSSPNALAISQNGSRLYVANGTDNAICVIDLNEKNVVGYIPTGWYPGAVILDKDEKYLFVANIKGIGSRNQLTSRPGLNSHDHMGMVSIIPMPDDTELIEMSETVKENNSFAYLMKQVNIEEKSNNKVPVPLLPKQPSHFKHVVYIIKENRTYDQVFGDMPQGNGDSSLVHFGRFVTPNHHALAEEFVLLDNFYCAGILSADGHQWTDEAYVTDYIEKFFGDFTRSYPYDGDDAIAYASSGFIWDNVLRNGLTFRNYGEFVDAEITPGNATFSDMYEDFKNGTNKIKIRAKANLEQLIPYTCETFPGFPNSIPELYRANEFIKELKKFEKDNNFPNFVIMLLPNDHTSGTRPGRPTPRAAVADNDLALGQIVEAVSNSKFWKETCIFVTEDDPQAGLDHVDGHRTVGLVISPYTKRGQVISKYYSQINMVRTMENILGIPPMNQFDATAEPMFECFTDQPDFRPYKTRPNNIPLAELNPALQSLSGDALYWAQKSLEQDLEELDRIEENTFNRIIWHAVKGYNVRYPNLGQNE